MVQDLTRGKPVKLILLFTIPLLIGNVFQQFYSMADTIIVGRTIGVDALAGVGATGSLSFLIIGFAQGLTAGLSVITAQRFGADDYDGVRKSVTVSLLISAVLTVVLTAIAVLTARPLLTLLQTPANIIDDAYDYIIIIFWGIFASMLFNLLSNVVRALGDSRTPLLFLIVACVLNIVLDFVFILAFKMGVAGAAWATVIAQVVSCALCILYIAKRIPLLRLCKKDWKVDASYIRTHCRVGLPMAFQTSIIAIGAMILQVPLNKLGSTAVGAFTAAQKIDNLAVQILMSFGITMATYAAQNYGAGQHGAHQTRGSAVHFHQRRCQHCAGGGHHPDLPAAGGNFRGSGAARGGGAGPGVSHHQLLALFSFVAAVCLPVHAAGHRKKPHPYRRWRHRAVHAQLHRHLFSDSLRFCRHQRRKPHRLAGGAHSADFRLLPEHPQAVKTVPRRAGAA